MSTLLNTSGVNANTIIEQSTNLKAWYPMYEQTDPLIDSSTNGNNMDIIEGAVANVQDYGVGRARYRAAAGNGAFGVTVTTAVDINDNNTNFIVCFRTNIGALATTTGGDVWGKSHNAGTGGCHMKYANGRFQYIAGGATQFQSTFGNYNTATDFHVCMVVDRTNGTQTLYKDGVADGTDATIPTESLDLSTFPFVIGGAGKAGVVGSNLDGRGDTVDIWDMQVYTTTSALPANLVSTLIPWLVLNPYKVLSTEQW